MEKNTLLLLLLIGCVLVINSGLILQWGNVGNTDIGIYPITFTEKLYSCSAILVGIGNSYSVSIHTDSFSLLDKIRVWRAVTWGWRYICIGI